MNYIKPTKFSYLPKFLMPLDVLGIFERDPFGNSLLVRRMLISIVGWLTYARYTVVNRIEIEGTEHLENLPINNVLFLSNHQTYFADVIAFFHIFCAVKWGFKNTLLPPVYLFGPRARQYYVAASETMKKGFVPRAFAAGGAITIERSWRADGREVQRSVDTTANDKIASALAHGWVVSFPQGTTKPYAPVRKGTGHLIKNIDPIVVPIVINGFRRAFDKKGLRFKKRNTLLTVKFKPPLTFSADDSVDDIVNKVRQAIDQDVPVWTQENP
ncbi:lysophospholipid acyltransferase family protein [Spirosoma terrae]|uniref:1-acyl-sn-glycerol-3-phosphate acyltransferase n=1 Tax=Spirosoma terrae TaxID=1968276 RepID=A0A6L9L337_9BACT|nr:lysophospholipid acyltransferase family protein [Spirosoma terrae]NDU93807.1 1-acyl-sn-glycerol-3-phosphate acyltransferase [Spirosoma terrae]